MSGRIRGAFELTRGGRAGDVGTNLGGKAKLEATAARHARRHKQLMSIPYARKRKTAFTPTLFRIPPNATRLVFILNAARTGTDGDGTCTDP